MIKDEITKKLTAAFHPQKLIVMDESHRHIGHPGAKEGGHFAIEIIADAFQDKTLVERHRMVYESLSPLMKHKKIHALRIDAKPPLLS